MADFSTHNPTHKCNVSYDLRGVWQAPRRLKASQNPTEQHCHGRDRVSSPSAPAILRMRQQHKNSCPSQAAFCFAVKRAGALRRLFSRTLVMAHRTESASVAVNARNLTSSSLPAFAEVTRRCAFIKRMASTDMGLVVP
jgi:hypothetical protein